MGSDAQPFELRKNAKQFVGEAIGEILIVSIAARLAKASTSIEGMLGV